MGPRRASRAPQLGAVVCSCYLSVILATSGLVAAQTSGSSTTTTEDSIKDQTTTMTIPAANPSAFEAAFQGECRPTSSSSKRNPCEHLCLDLHDGTYECSCFYGFTLAVDGYSCAKLAGAASSVISGPQSARRQRKPAGVTRQQGADLLQDNGRKLGGGSGALGQRANHFQEANEQAERVGNRSLARVESAKVADGRARDDGARGEGRVQAPPPPPSAANESESHPTPVQMAVADEDDSSDEFNGLEEGRHRRWRPTNQMDALARFGPGGGPQRWRPLGARRRQTEASRAVGARGRHEQAPGDHNEDGAIAGNWIKYNTWPPPPTKMIEFSTNLKARDWAQRKSIIAGRARKAAQLTGKRPDENKVAGETDDEMDDKNKQADWRERQDDDTDQSEFNVAQGDANDEEEEEDGDDDKRASSSVMIKSYEEAGEQNGRWSQAPVSDGDQDEDAEGSFHLDNAERSRLAGERIRGLDYDLGILERLVGKTMGDYYAANPEYDAMEQIKRRRRRRRRR